MNMISCKKSSQLHINASITNMKHTTRVECEKVQTFMYIVGQVTGDSRMSRVAVTGLLHCSNQR